MKSDASRSLLSDIEQICETEINLMRAGQIRDLAPVAKQKLGKLTQLEKMLKELPQEQVAREFVPRLMTIKSKAQQAAILYQGLLTGIKSAQLRLERLSGQKARIGTYGRGGQEMTLTDGAHDAEKRI